MADEQSRKNINKTLAHPLASTAGILGLVQGIVWTIFSILCICCYTGSIELDPSDTNGTEYYKLIYVLFLDANEVYTNNVIIKPKEFLVFSCLYLILSIVWASISGSIVWAMIHNKWNFSKPLFGTWSITTILISIVDIILMGLLVADYTKQNGSNTEVLVCYGIVMSIAARGYVLWIINIIFAVIIAKYAVSIIHRENKNSTLPIINGYESNEANLPWFNNAPKDFWAKPQPTTPTPAETSYDNHGFARSQSFVTPQMPNGTSNNFTYNNIYSAPPPNNIYSAPPNNMYSTSAIPATNKNNNNVVSTPSNNPTSFSEAIAHRTATIGKNKGRSPLYQVPPPIIPDPDYTPPNSPNGLKSVLRSKISDKTQYSPEEKNKKYKPARYERGTLSSQSQSYNGTDC